MDRVGQNPPVSPPRLELDFISGPEKMAQLSRLLDQNFGLQAPARFLDDFPVWDESFGPGEDPLVRIGVWDGPELVFSAGVKLAELRVPAGPMKVALIGAVATAESH